jgi:hypothetical protein
MVSEKGITEVRCSEAGLPEQERLQIGCGFGGME